MRKTTIASQPTSQQIITKCDTCRHQLDLSHDCSVHRCVMSERNGRVVVHECSGYWQRSVLVENVEMVPA